MKHELRPFRFWEQICSTMNLSLAFEVQGPITADLISKAWGLIKIEYPYFASTIHQDEYGQLHFKSGTGQGKAEHVRWSRHEEEIDFQPLLAEFANTPRDHTEALATLELHSSGSIHHYLLATVSHAGIDGLSTFHVFRTFFAKLGQLAYGYEVQPGEAKPNVDIGARVPPIDASKLKPLQLPHDHMPMLTPEPASGDVAYVEGEFAELTVSETARLVAKCKERGCTVQGAVSAASAVAIAQAQRHSRALPQTLLLQCPANMRRYVKPAFGDDETSCAASFLWWQQTLSPQETLWDVVKNCSASIKEESDTYGGLAFWARLLASKTLPEMATATSPPYSPPYTITASSVGINPIAVENGPLKVLRCHMMLSTFGITSETEAGTMTHAHTFANRLHVTMTYSMPAVGHQRGRAMAATQMAVLQVLASDNADVAVGDFMNP